MGFKLNEEVIEECAIAGYTERSEHIPATHEQCIRAAVRAALRAVARQLENVVSSPHNDLSTRLDQLLEFVPPEEPIVTPTPRTRRKS